MPLSTLLDKILRHFGAVKLVSRSGPGSGYRVEAPDVISLLETLVLPSQNDHGDEISVEQYQAGLVDSAWLLATLNKAVVNGFCIRCSQFTKHLIKDSRADTICFNVQHCETLANVFDAKTFGCQLCRILFLHLLKQDQRILSSLYKPYWLSLDVSVLRKHKFEFDVHLSYNEPRSVENLKITRAILLRRSNLVPHATSPPTESSTASESSTNLAAQWFRTCNRTHVSCKIGNEKREPPTRLIEILPRCERIVLTRELGLEPNERLEYATLSHCWGNLSFYTLTRDKLASMQKEIPHCHLTKTFQDAIAIARGLGIAYLWIDSLCIIQDNAEDWDKESRRMCDVYGGSSLNIAATGAPDGSYGCYRERDPCLAAVQRFRMADEEWYDCYDFDLYKQSILESPLAKRAWVFQERFLSTRTLHYGSEQIFWECSELFACEAFPEGVPSCLSEEHERFQKRFSKPTGWTDIVSQYTECSLTHSRDRLAAIDGIAQWFQKRVQMQNPHLAGHFLKDFEWQLVWQVRRAAKPPDRFRAPTWSWASIDVGVRWPDFKDFHRIVSHVIDVIPVNGDDSDTGYPWQARVLRLKCPGVRSIKSFDRKKMRIQAYWDLIGPDADISDSQDALCLPILWSKYTHMDWARGLLIRRDDNEQHYKRVGFFTLFADMSPILDERIFRGVGDEPSEKIIEII